MEPKVTLLSWTQNPIETIFSVWETSKTNDPLITPAEIAIACRESRSFREKVEETFRKVVDQKIPVAENIQFVFLLENVSISFREQMVRHRIGVKVGPRVGVDIVPDLPDSTWWAQSMRILDMSKFAKEDRYRTPESMKGKTLRVNTYPDGTPRTDTFELDAENHYHNIMKMLEANYKLFTDNGIPIEDAREILPMASQHRVSWALNMTALMHVVSKRGCWIAQGDLWGPVIEGMVNELATKVHPYFRTLVYPPCTKGGVFKDCVYKLENERRIDGRDETLPCSLYLHKNGLSVAGKELEIIKEKDRPLYYKMKKQYSEMWGRDPYTFEEIPLAV